MTANSSLPTTTAKQSKSFSNLTVISNTNPENSSVKSLGNIDRSTKQLPMTSRVLSSSTTASPITRTTSQPSSNKSNGRSDSIDGPSNGKKGQKLTIDSKLPNVNAQDSSRTEIYSPYPGSIDERYTEDLNYAAPMPITLEDRTGDTNTVTIPGGSHTWNVNVLRGVGYDTIPASRDRDERVERPNTARVNGQTGQTEVSSLSKTQLWAKDVHVGNYTIIQGNTGKTSKIGAYVVWTIEIEVMGREELEDDGNNYDMNKITQNEEYTSDGELSADFDQNDIHSHQSVDHVHSNYNPYESVDHRHCQPSASTRGAIITIHKRYSDVFNLRQHLWHAFPLQRHSIPELPPKSLISKFRETFLENRRKGLEYFLLNILLNPVFCNSKFVKEFVQRK